MSQMHAALMGPEADSPPPRTFNPNSLLLVGLVGASYAAVMIYLGVTPARIIAGMGRLWSIVLLMLPPAPGSASHFWTYLYSLWQTVAIAFVGTTAAAVFALPLGSIAARNVVAGRIVHFFARRALDCVRSVDTLVWALIWVNVVGLGPFAGALAIASTDVAALAKLMSEAIETGTLASGPVCAVAPGASPSGKRRLVSLEAMAWPGLPNLRGSAALRRAPTFYYVCAGFRITANCPLTGAAII
jgi:ABC-type phosphate/phosphonate transport system permease subunit